MILTTQFGNIYYEETGEGQPLLLVHDAAPGESADGFRRCVKRLAEKRRVFTVDLPGFGKSDKPSVEYSAYLFAKTLNRFVEEAVREPVTVYARGRGAAFAVMAAAFTPGNFKELYLIKPKGMPAKTEAGVLRAFFAGKDKDIRYALAKGYLDADYMRALSKITTPVSIVNGGCKLCTL